MLDASGSVANNDVVVVVVVVVVLADVSRMNGYSRCSILFVTESNDWTPWRYPIGPVGANANVVVEVSVNTADNQNTHKVVTVFIILPFVALPRNSTRDDNDWFLCRSKTPIISIVESPSSS